jgi:hypothetical protein
MARCLAPTYRAAAFFRLWPIAGSCSNGPVECCADALLLAAPHFGIGEDDDD